ncbi:hypothetical protein GQ457_06G010860 [Hibiscus cannabinus]
MDRQVVEKIGFWVKMPLVTVGDVLEPLEHFNSLFLQFWSLGYRYLCLGIDTQVQYRYPKWSLEFGYRYQGLGYRYSGSWEIIFDCFKHV